MPSFIDLTGKRFGRLTAKERAKRRSEQKHATNIKQQVEGDEMKGPMINIAEVVALWKRLGGDEHYPRYFYKDLKLPFNFFYLVEPNGVFFNGVETILKPRIYEVELLPTRLLNPEAFQVRWDNIDVHEEQDWIVARPLNIPKEGFVCGWGMGKKEDKITASIIIEHGDSGGMITDFENKVFMTLQLMACKNIAYEDYDPNKSLMRQQRRQRERKGKPLLKYKILHINPMSAKTITRKPKTEPINPGVPVHAVRGHFKTFTAEHPAFGNPECVGTYWCGPYVCGNPDFGLNWNDYHIEIEQQ